MALMAFGAPQSVARAKIGSEPLSSFGCFLGFQPPCVRRWPHGCVPSPKRANNLASTDVPFGRKHEPGGKMVLTGKSTQIRSQFRVNRLDGHKLDAVNGSQVGSHYMANQSIRRKGF